MSLVRQPWKIVGAADYNRDGNTDIVVQDTATGVCQSGLVLRGTLGVTISEHRDPQLRQPLDHRWTSVSPHLLC